MADELRISACIICSDDLHYIHGWIWKKALLGQLADDWMIV
jgi:hypothetical protein